LERLVHIRELQDFFAKHGEKRNWGFIDAVFEYLDFSYQLSEEALRKIPAEGRLICVANHATGPLDGLILLHLIGRVRQDVKIVLTDLLAELDQLEDLFLLYDQYASRLQKQNILAIRKSLLAEQAVIFFPAGEVTKLSWDGLREKNWMAGPLTLAGKYDVPILPVHLQARNSLLYYLSAKLHRNLSTLLLTHEMFGKRSQRVPVTIGELISGAELKSPELDANAQAERLKDVVYHLGKEVEHG
jgi:putative hemolysin